MSFSPLRSLRITFIVILIIKISNIYGQSLQVSSCPLINKRNNGNGQYSSSAGNFQPTYSQNNPVAANVTGTPYQHVSYNPAEKTGFFTFSWSSATPITNFPVITRVWITPTSSTTAVLSSIKFGPPSLPEIVGQNVNVTYSFYVQNTPPSGRVSLEFTDPHTNQPAFICTYDLQSNTAAATPTINCAPTITMQPLDLTLCGTSTASFTIAGDGIDGVQWQCSNDNITFFNISNGGDYSGVATTMLTINNPTAFDGKYFRAVLTGSTGCGSINSNSALLVAKSKPTASFINTSLCGIGSQSMAVNLTGTAPWSLTYTMPSGDSTIVSNITASPYYFSVNPSENSTYGITSVSDAYCTNRFSSGTVNAVITAPPVITPSNAFMCYGSDSFNLTYTSTGNPNQYTLESGVRAMPGFTTIVNAVLSSSPLIITIPSNVPVGVYDFKIVAKNSVTGCISESVPFTLTINSLPTITATAGNSGNVCSGSTITLTAAPSNLSSYAWTISPSATVLGTSATYNPTINANTTYTVTGVNANGCSASTNVSVTTIAGPTLSIVPSSPTICSGNATNLAVSGGNTYSWTPSAGLSATSGDGVVASPSTTTTYTITSQNLTGCQSSGTVTVTVTTPSISVTSSATICSGNIKTLTATGGSTYVWYPITGLYSDASATVAYTGTSLATVYAKPTSTITYYVQGTTESGCVGLASTTVTVSPIPINASTSTPSNMTFCTQGTTTFDLKVFTTSSVTSMKWAYSTDGISYTDVTTATTITGVTLTPTIYSDSAKLTLSAYGSAGYTGATYFRLQIVGSACTYNYSIFITDTKKTTTPPAPIASKTTICNGNSVTLTVGSLASGTTAQWQSSANNSTWTDITGATSASYTSSPTSNTYYRVVYNSGNGNCGATSISTLITVTSALSSNTVTPSTTCTSGSGTYTLSGSTITGGIFQWQTSSTSSSSGFSDVLGGSESELHISNEHTPVHTMVY